MVPGTVEGEFRKGAVDGGDVREADPNKSGLKRDVVARECVKAVDYGTRSVFLPQYTRCERLALHNSEV